MNEQETNVLLATAVQDAKAMDPSINERTARRCLNKLGFKFRTKQSKGVYHDGHDREDVQKYLHNHFLPRMKSYMRRTRFMREARIYV